MEVYDLIGIWVQSSREKGLFKGSFNYYPKTKKIKGELKDKHGTSIIKGLWSSEYELLFNKQYLNEPVAFFDYEFKKKGDLYVGEFRWGGEFNGEAYCEIYKPSIDWKIKLKETSLSLEGRKRFRDLKKKAKAEDDLLLATIL